MKPVAALLTGAVISSAMLAQSPLAGEWQRGAGVTVSGYLSDNICLSEDDEQTKIAGTVTPDVYLQGEGARSRLYLRAGVEYNSLGNSSLDCSSSLRGQRRNRQTLIPSLRYLGELEVVEDWLTLESDAFVSRNPIDPFAAGSNDSRNGRDNTNIIYQYGAGAVVQRRLSSSTDLRLRYHYSEQYNDVNLFGDSSEDRVEFDLGNGRGQQRFSTAIAGRYSKVMYEESDLSPAFDNTLAAAEVRAALRLSSDWELSGLVGEEWNEFTSVRPDIDGTYWDAGLRWTPNERVEVAAGTGERFFGSTPRMQIRYRHKRSEVTASYARTLTFPRNLRAANPGFEEPLIGGSPFPQDPGFGQGSTGPLTNSGQPTFIGDTPIIDERFDIRYRFTGRRNSISLGGSSSHQERTEDLRTATFTDLAAVFTRALSARTSARLRLGWSEREGDNEIGNAGSFNQHSQTWQAGLGLSRRVGSNTTVSADYQYTQQESDFAFNQYHENRITVSIRHQF